jgi:hypothetical protein
MVVWIDIEVEARRQPMAFCPWIKNFRAQHSVIGRHPFERVLLPTLAHVLDSNQVYISQNQLHCSRVSPPVQIANPTNMSRPNDSTAVQRRPHGTDDPLPREKLPDELQKIVDDEDTLLESLYDGTYVSQPTHSTFPPNLYLPPLFLHIPPLTPPPPPQRPHLHRFQRPLRRLRHSPPHHPPLRPPLRCLHLRRRRILPPHRPPLAHQIRLRNLLGVPHRRRRERGV